MVDWVGLRLLLSVVSRRELFVSVLLVSVMIAVFNEEEEEEDDEEIETELLYREFRKYCNESKSSFGTLFNSGRRAFHCVYSHSRTDISSMLEDK